MARIIFLAAEGCLSSSLTNLIDAFGIANRWHRALNASEKRLPFETCVVTSDGRPIAAEGGIQIQAELAAGQVERADVVVLPAFPHAVDQSLPASGQILPWLREIHERRITIATVCTGAFLLAMTGLLDGKKATTHWQFSKLFQRRHPKVRFQLHRILTEDSGFICTGAASAVFNLGLHLIRRYGSEELAAVCAKSFLIDPHRDSQAPYAVFHAPKRHGDHQVLQAQSWMEGHYAQNFTIDAVAAMVGLSPRHFKRRFRKATGESPLAYLQHLRIEAAKSQLAGTRANVNEITGMIGYEDSSTFRRLFKKQVGISPREYRDKFRASQAA